MKAISQLDPISDGWLATPKVIELLALLKLLCFRLVPIKNSNFMAFMCKSKGYLQSHQSGTNYTNIHTQTEVCL